MTFAGLRPPIDTDFRGWCVTFRPEHEGLSVCMHDQSTQVIAASVLGTSWVVEAVQTPEAVAWCREIESAFRARPALRSAIDPDYATIEQVVAGQVVESVGMEVAQLKDTSRAMGRVLRRELTQPSLRRAAVHAWREGVVHGTPQILRLEGRFDASDAETVRAALAAQDVLDLRLCTWLHPDVTSSIRGWIVTRQVPLWVIPSADFPEWAEWASRLSPAGRVRTLPVD